ncbi:MobF family relaxase [Sulfurospirillum barnesii]|uniref:Conjugative relaxase domain protein, TrwC/TraI family n=1 Tax=Sulfurospirillum barnesii (strain ATCC 700032 / DSM 10660 / SES-3) TaxID=760154 RepID=I3Y076_SULBS|nr:MobF family relaxase [Sulfurospirillum barnesii]AFL69600.1 conjugative relaxase domain protein, TrwC/TraI family [Sulfurospirillum barnesii SES-3]
MLAQPKITTASNARNYFEKDTYYLNNEFEQGSFYGGLKDELGLKDFNLKDFDSLLAGRHPVSGEQLIKLTKKDFDKDGDRLRAACDLTFAADKSISILYEVSSDDVKAQIREAFTESISVALDFAEANYSNSKSRDNVQGQKAQPKMIFTRFDHSESRNNDMHLHQHCLAINMIQDENGKWKSVEFNQIMMNHQLIGQIQRNSFAQKLQKLGFEVEITDAKVGTFSLKNVNKYLRDKFSTRKDDIKNEMAESGQTSYKATHTAQKQTAKWKDKNKDREAIQEHNIERLKEAGADIASIKYKKADLEVRHITAKECVQIAITDITDRKSVFSREDILKHALKVSLTTDVSIEAIQNEFKNYKDLIEINQEENQYTTKEVLEKETYIFSKKESINFSITSDKTQVDKAIKEFEKEKGFELKEGQTQLAHTILTCDKQFILAQGVAGAGKSTSLEIVKNVAEAQDIKVIALAPTGTATDNLAKEAGIKESYTVAKFIQENGNGVKDAIVIIDEAGMLGLRDTEALIKIAEENNLKLVFSGDQNQKKSISQGDIFAGMQRQGFETVYLDEGNRQKNHLMKNAVKNILDKDISAALNILKDTTREIKKPKERLKAAEVEYLKDRHNSLLITTTNSDRRALNSSIRSHLIGNGKITESKNFATREVPSMSALEKRSAIYYQVNEKVYLSKNIGSISAGREAIIKKINIDKNTLEIEHFFKDKTFTETVYLSTHGNSLNLFKETFTDFGVGEQVIMKKNDSKLGLKNGQIGTITAIVNNEITVQFEKAVKTFSLKDYKYIQHAYAITDFASQGKTTDKVIAVANSQSASFNDFYTQITRAKFEAHIITDNLKELQLRAARDSQKLNATDLISAQEKKETTMQQPTQPKQLKLTQEEFSQLSKRTKDELKLTDPAAVLNALGIPYKEKNGRYEFKVRSDDKTASANMYIDKLGEWKYNDFGGNNGTIENLIMETTKVSYKEALDYAIVHLGITNHVKERLDELNGTRTAIRTASDLSFKMQENLKRAEIHINSKVTSVKELKDYAPAVEYLASRGIHKIPPQLKMITGEYMAKDGTIKKAFGVGIESIGGGGDIHFLKPLGSLKSMNLGEKNISLFKSQTPTQSVCVFESKMCYAAAYNQRDFTHTDVIIANSTSNAHKVAEAIKDKYTQVAFYNQNDKPGIDFVKKVSSEAQQTDFTYIKYQKNEQGKDINDLHKDGVQLEEREEKSFMLKVKETYKGIDSIISSLENFKEFYDFLTHMQKGDVIEIFNSLEYIATERPDLARASCEIIVDFSKDITDREYTLEEVAKNLAQEIYEEVQERPRER